MVELQGFPTRARSDGLGSIAGLRSLSTSIDEAGELALPHLEQGAGKGAAVTRFHATGRIPFEKPSVRHQHT